jgi:hypothetical protein
VIDDLKVPPRFACAVVSSGFVARDEEPALVEPELPLDPVEPPLLPELDDAALVGAAPVPLLPVVEALSSSSPHAARKAAAAATPPVSASARRRLSLSAVNFVQ